MLPVYWLIRRTLYNNLNMFHTRKSATRSFDVTDLGREADRPIKKVNFDDQLQGFEPPAILDQLEKLGVYVSVHCRSLRARHLALLSD